MPNQTNTDPNPSQAQNLSVNNYGRRSIFQQLGLTGWAQRFVRAASQFCVPIGSVKANRPNNHLTYHGPHASPNTLEAVANEGWDIRPPRPQEAGPNYWLDLM